eukprot:15327882-Alexandrium_andersonii.AAC.1
MSCAAPKRPQHQSSGLSRANSQVLRGLQIGGLRMGAREFVISESARTPAQKAPLESFGNQLWR